MTMSSTLLYSELTRAILDLATRERTRHRESKRADDYFYSYGIYTTPLRALLNSYKPRILALELESRLKLALRLYKTRVSEYASAATFILALSRRELTPAHFAQLDRMLDHYHSWGTTDDLCVNVMYALVEKYPRESIALCRRWNRSPNPWKRRASVVAFTRRIGASGKFTREVLALCENLLWDEEDLVQKGVGWTLKDNLHGNKPEVLAYVKDLRRRGVSSVITLYAIRDLKGKERAEVLRIKQA